MIHRPIVSSVSEVVCEAFMVTNASEMKKTSVDRTCFYITTTLDVI